MAEGPYVLVHVQGTNADGLFCVKSKNPAPPVMAYIGIEDDMEVVRVVVFADYVDETFEDIVHKTLPVSFNTTKLYVLGGEQARPDQRFCKECLDRNGGVEGVSVVHLGQRQARFQDAEAVQYGEQRQQSGPRRRIRVGQSQPQSHKRDRDNELEAHSVGLSSRTRSSSLNRGPYGTKVIHTGTYCLHVMTKRQRYGHARGADRLP